MIWSENKTVSPHDLDLNNIMSASAILRALQDAAYDHMYYTPPSMDDLRREGKVFLLSRISMTVYAPIRVCEGVVAETWACESKGVSFLRCSRLLRNGEPVAELSAIWALLDVESGRLLRVTEYPQSYSNEPPLDVTAPARIRIPRDVEMTLAGEYTVSYNDVDINRHVNNTNYPDILCGFLGSMEGKRAVKVCINYIKEAPLGDTLKVYVTPGEEEDSYLFRTVRSDGAVNVEAYIVLDKAES
ncbi:MAG: hypothetical protein IKB34_07145 [Clostridia bacterium]|nr:hypothetical protein [Clostridia bacterium]